MKENGQRSVKITSYEKTNFFHTVSMNLFDSGIVSHRYPIPFILASPNRLLPMNRGEMYE